MRLSRTQKCAKYTKAGAGGFAQNSSQRQVRKAISTVPRAKRPDATLKCVIWLHIPRNLSVASGRFARGTVIIGGCSGSRLLFVQSRSEPASFFCVFVPFCGSISFVDSGSERGGKLCSQHQAKRSSESWFFSQCGRKNPR